MEFTQEQLEVLKDSLNPAKIMDEPVSVNALREKMVDLVGQRELLKNQLKQVYSDLEKVMSMLGVGETFQSGDGTVYKIQRPTGTFISFKEIDYVRTRKEGEKGGNYLSKKEAEELGFKMK